jgi:hypothetical protein
MQLLVGFYQDADPARTAEFVECVRRNAANPHLDRVTVFLEDRVSPADVAARHDALAHPKVRLVEHGRRLTFAHLFEYANRNLAGATVIIANADIFFDETLALLADAPLERAMLCLSRWDESADGAPRHFDRPDSQDAWVFEAPVAPVAADFCLGVPGCDNRLAWEAERAGLAVTNPSRSVRARHLHRSAVRRYTPRDRLHGPVRLVPASFLAPSAAAAAPAEPDFPSHRTWRAAREADARARELEALLAPHLGGALPRALRRELRAAVSARLKAAARPADASIAAVAFRETMGYALATLEPGASTHHNDPRPLVSIPAALAGLRFTQVVANHAAPVEVEFRTAGRVYVLAAPGWEGFAPAAAFLDAAGWREPVEPLRAADGTRFEVWTLAAEPGERFVAPTQVMLAARELVKLP